MAFLSGPRQIGKTTCAKTLKHLTDQLIYLNWDNIDDRNLIYSGPAALAAHYDLLKISKRKPILVFDEIHKYSDWKNILKGFFDVYQTAVTIVVTGSAKLNVYQKGNDSMMGRYFSYEALPLSVAELKRPHFEGKILSDPVKISNAAYQRLLKYGGFPEPFVKNNERFWRVWSNTRLTQLFQEDLRDLTKIYDLSKLEHLSTILMAQSSELTNYDRLAKHLAVSNPTIQNWIQTLSQFYFCFTLSPWTKNVTRSLLKQPKIYLWDWSLVQNSGQKHENFVAVHLMKAVALWNQTGLGQFGLHFIRDKEKREVDFIITREQTPWILIEVKSSQNAKISPSLIHFHQALCTEHAFQVAIDMPYVDIDVFKHKTPLIVPAPTFLSQLV